MDLEHLEALALSNDRSTALGALLPGTVEHDYWRGVQLQHAGRLDEVDEILGDWQRRHGHTDEHHQRLSRRQLLLRAGADLAAHADTIRFEAGVWLNDEAEAVAAAQRHPTSFDNGTIHPTLLLRDAQGRSHDLSYVTDWALTDLVATAGSLDATRRRHLLQRLPRANLPGVVALIAADLGEKSSRGFGSLPIHHQLTRAQLDELAGLRKDLRALPAFVDANLARMRPAAHVDWQLDVGARAAYLAELAAFAASLPPSFNALKAHVLYHQLDLDRRRGTYDRARFLAYLELPRQAHYVSPDWLKHVPGDQLIRTANAGAAAGLEPVPDDEPLVRDYLERFLATEGSDAFAHRLRKDWLDEVLAATRLLAGAAEPDRWAAILGPAALAALRDRVDLELTVRNPPRFGAGDAVALEVDVKNVPVLVVKVFRINALAYFLARGAEVDTSLDLDGMVASDERTIKSDAPAIVRRREQIDLPGCARPGTYVVELIGNGKSSRALIRKGGLRHTVRVGAAGPTVRVLDDAGRAVPDARIWLGGRELTPRDDGGISIPFSTQPSAVPILIVHGELAQREVLHHPAEHYAFTAGMHLQRQSVVPGKIARVVLRPMLTLAGWPAPLALIEDPRVELTVTDLVGTSSTKLQPVTFADDAETVVELHVPEDTVRIGVAVRGQIRVASTQQTIDIADSAAADVNGIHREAHTEALHLATTDAGHVLHLLGKTGEPRGGRAIAIAVKHVAVTFDVATTLETDAQGRVALGALDGVERVTATLPSGLAQTWWLAPWTDAPRAIHAVAGAPITLPAPERVTDPRASLVLHEVRGGAPVVDHTDRVKVVDRALVIDGLDAGQYVLACRDLPAPIGLTIVPAHGALDAGWSTSGPMMAELSPPLPLCRALSADASHVIVKITDASAATRVHVIGARFRPDLVLPRPLHRAPRAPHASTPAAVRSHYVSGRDIGDEYRYVLERRTAPRRPGTLLDKPSLLLNPWALRTTSTAVQDAMGGGAYAASPPRPAAAPAAPQPRLAQDAGPNAAFATYDFLPAPAAVLANLRPDADGLIRVPRSELADAQLVRVMVIDPALTSYADLALPEHDGPVRDRRLRLALDPAGHFSEDRRVTGAPAGTTLVVDDVRTGKLELVDTLARAHQLLLTLGADGTLRDFAFVTQWHALDEATRRARYSKYACHELHLFLHAKDPTWFARVVKPYLAAKRVKTFVDRYLLDDDLAAYLEPWAFGRLNTLERVLLARKVPAVRDAVARLIGDAVDLIPPDPEGDARLVDTLLGAAALEGGGVMGEVAKEATEMFERAEKPKKRSSRARSSTMAGPAEAEESEAIDELAMDMDDDMPSAGAPASKMMAADTRAGGYGAGAGAVLADLRERQRGQAMYRGADKTSEWAESDWWHVRVEDAVADLIPANRYWRDLARHRDGAFLSPHLGECTHSFAEALAALAVLDLPFTATKHDVVVDDTRLALTTASHALAARTQIAAIAAADARSPILVGQSYFRADDRWEWDGAEQREKYVTGELLVGVVYQCQVVVTNPTSAQQKLDVLLQIPRGAIPVSSGFLTRTLHLHLGAYGTQSLEYAFYFPRAGSYGHFPAHVTRAGELVASAPAATLEVVDELTQVDTTSWAHVSQHGTTDDVLAFLDQANLGRVELDKIAWRMRDADAFRRVTALLATRHAYHDRLWAYALAHADPVRVAEWLRHQDGFVRPAGPILDGGVVTLDPVTRAWYQHLEYAPLINARAHQLGARRRILNDALAAQYEAFLGVVAHRARPTDDDLLAAAHYMMTLDRNDDALAALARVRADHVATPLQHAYLAAYAACSRGDLAEARRLVAPHVEHPVDRWRHRFAALAAMLDEAEGRGPAAAAVDADSRDQKMAELAARQPSLELVVEQATLVVQHHNLAACQVRFYRMDIELLFSRQPFVQGDVERFSWIDPGHVLDLTLELPRASPAGSQSSDMGAFAPAGRTTVPIPDAMRGANLVVEAVAPGLRRSVAHYAHDLATQLTAQYGQVRVLRASSQAALPATYVKVYARQHGGNVAFFKDGYTDLRGRFDYATLSTDDLDRVERFALLVVSDDAGATVLEAAPPPR